MSSNKQMYAFPLFLKNKTKQKQTEKHGIFRQWNLTGSVEEEHASQVLH